MDDREIVDMLISESIEVKDHLYETQTRVAENNGEFNSELIFRLLQANLNMNEQVRSLTHVVADLLKKIEDMEAKSN
jgi:hypothetical protein